ncbi:MAG: MBL fold metallo-hydrolase [Planctomycetes bacterium]|nr:MBL fold metallo-hydrolase [Planctomycetota bacterium]
MTAISKKCLLLLALFGLSLLFAGEAQCDQLKIYWCDVEGGAATLIVTPQMESVLIDAGLPGDRDPARIYRLAKEVAGIERIDHMVATHFDLDHYGGIADLSRLMPIENFYDPGIPEKHDAKRVGEYKRISQGKRKVLKPGDEIQLVQGEGLPALRLHCLGSAQKFVTPPLGADENGLCETHKPMPEDTTENANSTVLLLNYGAFDFLDAADLTWQLEMRLVCPVNLVGTVDVFQVDHHGLNVSNNPVLVGSLQPRVAVMNNGVSKGCATSTVKTLRNTSSIEAVYQLHRNLPIGGNAPPAYIANAKADCQAAHVELTVERLGDSYTVAIPANAHRELYQSK